MRVLLISTYDLGRQPFGLASPAAWLREAGADVECVDTSRTELEDTQIAAATLVAFYLPMHTATRLAAPLIERTRRVNPSARMCAYGLYAPLNADWLRERGVTEIIGPEAEAELVGLVSPKVTSRPTSTGQPQSAIPDPTLQGLPRLRFITPDRVGLPALERYASLRMPDGSRRVMGSSDATRGCKHLCRHCPIVPIYQGQFRVVPLDVVMEDVRGQVAAGAQHISFADPDFFNGPTHARHLVERVHAEWPDVSYDVTIKIEHLLKHADMLPVLRETGCLFITSAVEAIDDVVLGHLMKGHTRADFVAVAGLCRDAGVTLVPTFVPFTPWTTLAGYVELLEELQALDLVEQVAPIQLAIRLLVTSGSPLLELSDVRAVVAPFDPASLTWPWTHRDPAVDALQTEVMELVGSASGAPRGDVFAAISALAREHAGLPSTPGQVTRGTPVPCVSEPWYCCAEPMDSL
ncbi:MAG: CUAEP/CCAEP-tail radical SAM protein [Acidobacteria bacterium]|nr:CUAEP/CCAEP-tail radical SAM protein [Acidobacteriota bacterium]